ncbi:precorrin-2 dehydrogenase/sirohydrochlorin ferrochelatase [Desulfohalotomaculum tongense]|uniref:precorrin-2 dehydrogenase/sirohydrochlorin ferrochelatase family protein n=1 Tax=Desulforadius tongensis TaxID=1216062 RepID=UPI0019575A10|nr:bifunctional precorrin-2 dehydrogenase/sirohydrochlorin ferrochelatase [Desulforadius tongensis]MBM7855577.1 precorrin-2 dehydrogenase/sirohydrochlorin ferrochelatase [Desulforadius tongensis]
MTEFYPLYLRLEGEKCLVVGGGKVAERKVKKLLESGADIVVVSPRLTPGLAALKEQARITHIERECQEKDLQDAFLVFSATDDEEVNRRVAEYCIKNKILVNIVDDPQRCSFFVPAVVRQGPLSVAVSTNGKSPLLAARIREQLENTFGPEYADFLELLGQVRVDLLQRVPEHHKRREVLEKIVQSDILKLYKEKRYDKIKERVQHAYRSSGC